MQVMGLDLSLTRTGVALPGGTTQILAPGPKWLGVDRLRLLRSEILTFVGDFDVELVVIEGYSYNSRNGGERLGELGGVVRLAIADFGVDYVDVPPASLKRYATGKGNASKSEVLAAAIRRLHYDGADDNEADALWLQQMAWCHYYGDDAGLCVPMPAAHREGLAKVPWPDIAAPEVVA